MPPSCATRVPPTGHARSRTCAHAAAHRSPDWQSGRIDEGQTIQREALAQQQQRIDTLPCPLFKEINRAIAHDEARHAAFGVLYLRKALPRASAEDRAVVTEWVKGLWRMWTQANEGRYLQAGAEVLRLERAQLAGRWGVIAARLERLGLARAEELSLS